VIKLDDYLHQKTGTLHVSETAFELGEYTALGKFDDLATARRAIQAMDQPAGTAVALAQSAVESMPDSASEDAAGFVARRVLSGALVGALISGSVTLAVVAVKGSFDTRGLLTVLFTSVLGAMIGGLFNVYARLGDDREIHQAPTPAAGQFYVALHATDPNGAQRFAELMRANRATEVEVLDRSNEGGTSMS
jgi:hypothetical protein